MSEQQAPEIPGWFDFEPIYDEAVTLAQHGETLVEIGSWFGKSTAYLAAACKAMRPARSLHVLAIDTWTGTQDGNHPALAPVVAANGGDILPAWRANMLAAGVADAVTAWRSGSLEAAAELSAARGVWRFPFVFLDDDHSLEHVRLEIRAWLPFVAVGGMMAGHDYDRAGTVRRAVIERFGSRVIAVRPRSWKTYIEADRSEHRTPGLCLAFNYGDDPWTIERLIDSAAPHVSGVVARGTRIGEDALRARAYLQAACKRHGLPLLLEITHWRDYATDQTALLAAAKRAGYAWAWNCDADEEIAGNAELPAELDPMLAAYDVCRLWSNRWEVWTPRIFNLAFPVSYQGARHAQPVLAGSVARLEGADVLHWADDSNAPDRERFERDYARFAELAGRTTGAQRSRAVYYMAQSAKDAGMRTEALDAYRLRLQLPEGFDEERYISALEIARLSGDRSYYWAALDLQPNRYEARVELAASLRRAGAPSRGLQVLAPIMQRGAPPSRGRFLVDRQAERSGWADEWAACQAAVNAATEAMQEGCGDE